MTLSAALLAVLALAVGAGVLLAARRRLGVDRRVRLYEVMHLRGAAPPLARDPSAARDLADAERRCATCASKALCDEMLRTGRSRRYGLFCPNAIYIEWLRSTSLRFD